MSKYKDIRILGIDPGIAITGWGVVDYNTVDCSVISYGSITTEAKTPTADRLEILYDDLSEIIDEFNPVVMAIEQLFYFKNAKTIITVGEARGVTILAAKKSNLVISEYTPLQIKQAITGYGRAKKGQVQKMVKSLLHLEEIPSPDDTADALAVAYTHSVYYNHNKIVA